MLKSENKQQHQKNQWATSVQIGATSGQIVRFCWYLHNFQRPEWVKTMSPIMDNTFAIDFFSGCMPVLTWAWAKLESVPPPESGKPCFSLFAPNSIAPLCQEELFFGGSFSVLRGQTSRPCHALFMCIQQQMNTAKSWDSHSIVENKDVPSLPTAFLHGTEKQQLVRHKKVQRRKTAKVLTKSHKENKEKCFFFFFFW